jgi:hypothetical protein
MPFMAPNMPPPPCIACAAGFHVGGNPGMPPCGKTQRERENIESKREYTEREHREQEGIQREGTSRKT